MMKSAQRIRSGLCGPVASKTMSAIVALTCVFSTPFATGSNLLLAKSGGVNGESRFVERGRYLVGANGCNECHTAGFVASGSKLHERGRLAGSKVTLNGSAGTVHATNLRLFFRGITEQQWVVMAKERQPEGPMPYAALNAMSTTDLMAIYRYIRFLGPADDSANQVASQGPDAPRPYVLVVPR